MTNDIIACHAPWTLEPLELDADELLWHAVYGDGAESAAAAEELARRCGATIDVGRHFFLLTAAAVYAIDMA